MKAPVLKHVLFEYLSGRANTVEKHVVESWLRDAENRDTFHQWLFEWETHSPQFTPDQDRAMRWLMSKIDDEEQKPQDPMNGDEQSGKPYNSLIRCFY